MKILLLLSLVVHTTTGQSISQTIDGLQNLFPAILKGSSVFNDSNSYQWKARNAAIANLRNNPTPNQVRAYYALACIYYATNSVSNPRTQEVIPGAKLAPWLTETKWIVTTDYCQWYGISCNSSGSVRAIELPENNLLGSWPDEVVLLKNSLQLIELFNNLFLYSSEPKWLQQMDQLQFLYFGRTAWTYPGIPVFLSGCTNLIELDMSETSWSNGPIRPAAFASLQKLEYLDMGENTYDTTTIRTIPSQITDLPLLQNFYLDNVRFTPNPVDLSFLPNFKALYECWMDFTTFGGVIPTGIGQLSSLISFSCTYCGLTGPIPAQIGNTQIDRLWLFANQLEGTIPDALGTGLTDLTYLFLESNKLIGGVPNSICQRRKTNSGSGKLLELGADCTSTISCACCTCCGAACGNLEPVTIAPTRAPSNTGSGFICFSGDSEVEVQNKGSVKMTNLALGDSVRVADGKFEPVYSFGHTNADASGEFLQIVAEGRKLEISKDHMVVIEGGRSVPASMVKKGDMLVTASGNPVPVKDIRTVIRQGVFAPFTESGYVVVNDVVASNYIAYQGSEYLKIAGVESPFSYQWLAHMYNSVHRLAYKMGMTGETYTSEGTSTWVSIGNMMGSWMLDQNAFVLLGLLVPCIAIFGLVTVLEFLVKSPMITTAVAVVALSMIATSRSVSVKLSKKFQ